MGAPTIELDWLVLPPKPPSSGMTTDWAAFDACLAAAADGLRTVLKVAVFDDADPRMHRHCSLFGRVG